MTNKMSFHEKIFDSPAYEKCAVKIVEFYFDIIVARVARAMCRSNTCGMQLLCTVTKLPRKQVSNCLHILIQHNLAVMELPSGSHPTYNILKWNVLYLMRRHNYVHHVRGEMGVEAELVLDHLLGAGWASASQIIVTTSTKLAMIASPDTGGSVTDYHIRVRNEMSKLVEQHCILRCSSEVKQQSFHQNCILPTLQDDDDQPRLQYIFPSDILDLSALKREVESRICSNDENGSLAIKLPQRTNYPDAHILWTINYDTFHLHWRNSYLIRTVTSRIGTECGEVLSALLKSTATTLQDKWQSDLYVTTTQMRQSLPHSNHLDHCLTLLENETGGALRRLGIGGGGGEYNFDVATYVLYLNIEFVAKSVKEKFGSNAARIFRLVQQKSMMSGEVLAKRCYMDMKECDQLSNVLLQHRYIFVHDLRKPSIPSYNARDLLYKANFLEVVRMMARQCFVEVYNIMQKRELLFAANKSLMEKKTRVDAILNNIRSAASAEQIQEVEEALSQTEREAISKWQKNQEDMLTVIEGLCDDMFLFELYLRYHPCLDNPNTGRRTQS
uniref:DNA-directed RNA polymerase III subunit RPC3 n=1 Tax=Hirondellea gigas TaxID=1518452 RepID=A0A2P2I6K4_9CRUS